MVSSASRVRGDDGFPDEASPFCPGWGANDDSLSSETPVVSRPDVSGDGVDSGPRPSGTSASGWDAALSSDVSPGAWTAGAAARSEGVVKASGGAAADAGGFGIWETAGGRDGSGGGTAGGAHPARRNSAPAVCRAHTCRGILCVRCVFSMSRMEARLMAAGVNRHSILQYEVTTP